MSDGMSDSRALGQLGNKIEDAGYELLDAIRLAEQGHRGLTVDLLDTVNEVIKDTPYKLVRK